MDNKEEAEYITKLACNAMKIPSDNIEIETMPLKIKILLQDDTLLPVIVALSNVFGESLLAANNQFESIHPFDLQKTTESLCFVKILENNKKCAPLSTRLLVTMEIVSNIFEPSFDNKIDLTHLVKTWREVLNPIPEGKIINLNEFHNELIMNNLNYISKNIPNNKLNKSK